MQKFKFFFTRNKSSQGTWPIEIVVEAETLAEGIEAAQHELQRSGRNPQEYRIQSIVEKNYD